MPQTRALVLAVLAMIVIVVASNYLVQFPVTDGDLGQFLTWGAISYPVSFLVTDLINRFFGPEKARRVVYAGFATGVAVSVAFSFLELTTLRIAIASGAAFLAAQLLDVTIFNRLRAQSWWRAPFIAGAIASAVDTGIFFSVAFAGTEVPWTTLALGDFVVKLCMALFMLAPFRLAIWRAQSVGFAK
jgi:uncharacterized PurR-regulated membrane protein YhhQ (DUF165 family)